MVKGADSSSPLWPGKKAGENPDIVEATFEASAPALPSHGRDEIAVGIPPIGYAATTVGVAS